jgi:hypothetical protein
VDGDPRPRPGGARRLKDISHLYLSQRSPARPQTPAMPRRSLRIGVAAEERGGLHAEVCANLAVQFARLRIRTLVFDLDPGLPNVGFRLGLAPGAYLAHVLGDGPVPRVERAVLGIRVVVGMVTGPRSDLPEAVQQEVDAAACILVCMHAATSRQHVERLAPAVDRAPEPTTMTRAASAHSPMFEAWMASATARRPAARLVATTLPIGRGLDAAIAVGRSMPQASALAACVHPAPVHALVWGGEVAAGATPWARVPLHPTAAALGQPVSSLDPEHPASRLYENLAQALLAGLGRHGGPAHV